MNYLKNEVSLLQSIKNNFDEDIKQAIINLLDGYNRLFALAINQQEYIKRKRPEYAQEMEQNFKLVERNKFLEESIKRYKELNKSEMKYSKEIERELRMTKKLLETYQDNSDSKK